MTTEETTSETAATLNIKGAKPENAGSYWCVVTNSCNVVTSAKAQVTVTTMNTDVPEVIMGAYRLSGSTPNPVLSVATIKFSLANTENAEIKLVDANGNMVVVLANGVYNAGSTTIDINISNLNLASGTYFYTLTTKEVTLTQKMVVIK